MSEQPFCSNLDCPCATNDPQPCEEYVNNGEIRGQLRCFRCGWMEDGHAATPPDTLT